MSFLSCTRIKSHYNIARVLALVKSHRYEQNLYLRTVCVGKCSICIRCPPFLTFVLYPTKQVNYKVSSTGKIMHFCYRRTIRQKQENFSCNNKTNFTRRHKFITHKNNLCQVVSRSCNDQPLLVNEYTVKGGWQSSSLKNKLSGFRRAKHKHLLSKSKSYSMTSYEHVSILTFGGL